MCGQEMLAEGLGVNGELATLQLRDHRAVVDVCGAFCHMRSMLEAAKGGHGRNEPWLTRPRMYYRRLLRIVKSVAPKIARWLRVRGFAVEEIAGECREHRPCQRP